MKINEAALQQILQAYSPKRSGESASGQKAGAAGDAGRSDAVTISPQALELQRMIQAALASQDVRAERVQELQTKLRTGSYMLNPQEIANRMLGLNGGGQ